MKLEFHEDDWPHFHFIFLTRRFLPGELLTDLWGLGFTEVARITESEFRYLLKYVTKDGRPPEWVLRMPRIRIFQTSPGFLVPVSHRAKRVKPLSETRTRKVDTIGQRIERWRRTATLEEGACYRQVQLARPFREILAEEVMTIAQDGRYLGNGSVIIGGQKDLLPWKIKR
ncbi:hypothetical protein [Nibricoccus sp. IMCC34717]|uniref:rolling circle replication-associated protein n=1 Tax=Nibricoccus sp. IMCC34717 TaxID=3034021 RepID=UPI00385091B1